MGGQGFDISFQRELQMQSWPLYGVGMFFIALRTFARCRRAGSASLLAPDDWLMMTAVPVFYTILIVFLNVIATGGGSNLYPPEQFDTFTENDIKERIKGSKFVIVSEQAMLNVIWTMKVCMLFMYMRMTQVTKHFRYVRWLAVYVAIGWVAVEVTFFTACRPFRGYWGVPPPDPQCTTLEHYAMVQAVFNLSSDFCMLLIPIPMLVSLSLPLKQKIILGIVFSMGIFVIIAAILTKVYNLSDVYDTSYMLWYVREASVAVYVTNLPGIWPLLREHFRFLRSSSSYPSGILPRYGGMSQSHQSRTLKTARSRIHGSQVADDEIELGRQSYSKSTSRSMHSADKVLKDEDRIGHFGISHTRKGSPESDERALNQSSGWGGMNLAVHVDKTIKVNRVSWDRSEEFGMGMGHVANEAPKVKIEGPDGEVISKQSSR